MLRRSGLALACVIVLGVWAGPAGANLAAVGPVNPATGFPLWFQDATGLQLELGLDANTFFDPPIAGNALSVARGFGSEAFWFLAEAITDVPGGQALLVMGVEAAYLNGPPVAGEEIAFGRIRIRIDCPVAGAYRVTHPYGQETFNVVTPGRRAINSTVDIIGQAPNFAPALATAVGPFLRAVAPAAPAGYIGNAFVPQTVAGSPTGRNFFRIEGPPGSNLGGPGVNTITIDQFTLSGKIFVPPVVPGQPPAPLPTPLIVQRATATIDLRDVPNIDIFVQSQAGANVTATVPGRPPVTLTGDATGLFFTRIVLPRRAAIPASIEVSAQATGQAASTTTATLTVVDTVSVRRAVFDASRNRLIILAQSSNRAAVLTAVGRGQLANGSLIQLNVTVPPANVTVESSLGGSATAPVEVVGTPRRR